MFIEVMATVFAGIACAGVAMASNKVLGRRTPKWILPVAAGLGMIAMTISNDYTWFNRTSARLPEGVYVAATVNEQSWRRPWTQLRPVTKRFVAVDVATARKHENLPNLWLADLYLFGRWSPVDQAPLLLDCAKARSALLADGADFTDDSTMANADWDTGPTDDQILKLVCEP